MSDTPRTDAKEFGDGCLSEDEWPDFARQLEREIAELNRKATKEISKWENFARDEQLRLGKVICEQIDLRSELERQLSECHQRQSGNKEEGMI